MPFCPECGATTTTGDPFCGECGELQETPAFSKVSSHVAGSRPVGTSMTGPSNTPPGIQLTPGTLLADRYKILRRIGGGGMGSVYLAEDQNLANRLVAVKEMVEMFADESARGKAIEDFKRESELLARLDHPAIPTIYQYFLDASRGRYYLVMKYIEGGDLARRQEEIGGKVDEPTVTQWGLSLIHISEPTRLLSISYAVSCW